MALDPSIIAALSAGAKTSTASGDWDAWRKSIGGESQGGAWNLGQGIIDILSTGGYATAGLTNKIGQNIAAIGRGELGAAADLINPASGFSAMVKGVSDRRTYSENLKEMGVDPNAAVWLGLALDIGLDPTTYITGGALAGAKGAAQGARIASTATKAGKIAPSAAKTIPIAGGEFTSKTLAGATRADAFVPVNRALTDQEKIGNLLAGIQRGYATGRDQYKLSIKGNKLRKIQAKKRKTLEEAPRGEVAIEGSLARTPIAADVMSTVEKITAKEKRAQEQFNQAKSKVDVSALPGVTAGLSKSVASKIAADAGKVIATVEKTGEKFSVVVRSPEGQILKYSAAKKLYKTEANALKAAEKAAKEVEAQLKSGADLDARQSTAAATANDEVTNDALRPVEGTAEDARIKAELAEAGRRRQLLNELAQSTARPDAFLKPRKYVDTDDAAVLKEFEDAKEELLVRFDEFWNEEAADLAFSTTKIAETTIEDLNKYATAANPKPNALFDALLVAPASIPSSFRELLALLQAGRIAPNEATIGDLIFFASEEGLSPTVLTQAQKAFEISKDTFEEARAASNVTLKPWIDGIVTPNDAEDAIRGLMDYIYSGLRKDSKAYKAIVKTISDAFAGKLKAVSGGMDKPLESNEVEEVFEAFFAGANIPRALDKVGAIDLAKLRDETYNDIAEFTADLQTGTLKLSEIAKRDLANILGVPPSNIEAALVKITTSADGLGRTLNPDGPVQLIKGEIPLGEAVTATGNATGQAAADIANAALDVDKLEDIAAQAADPAAPMPTAELSLEAQAAYATQRERFAADRVNDEAILLSLYGGKETERTIRAKVVEMVRDVMLPAVRKQITQLAKARGKSLEEVIDEVIVGDLRTITEDPAAITYGGALKLNELSSHADIDMYDQLIKFPGARALYRGTGSKGPDYPIQREAYTVSAVHNAFRELGIPVRSSESAAAAAKREGVPLGQAKTQMYSSVKWADIAKEMLAQNKGQIAFNLRRFNGDGKAGYSYGNFVPTALEAAWLNVKRMKEAGADFSKGTENREEIYFFLNNVEKKYDPDKGGVGEFTAAPQALYVQKNPGEAARIQKAADDYIDFLDANYDKLKELDNSREGLLIAQNGQAVFTDANQIFAGLIRFSAEFANVKQGFKAGQINEEQLTKSFGELLADHSKFIDRLNTGEFSDRKLAQNSASFIKSILINAKIAGAANVTTPGLVQQAENTVATIRSTNAALESALRAGKSTAEAERRGKAARTTQKGKNLQQDLEIAQKQLAEADAAGNALPAAEEASDAAVLGAVSLNNAFAKMQTIWTKTGRALSGNYGMGAFFKTILSSSEQSAISWSHRFSLGLRDIHRATKGREQDVETAFKALQAYRKELDAAEELGEELSLDAFLADYGNVDMEIFNSLSDAFDVLLGNDNIFGAARSFSIMKSELNDALRQFGLGSLRIGDGQTLDNFWHAYEPKENGKAISAFEFLNLLNLSVHRAASRVEIASQFSQFVGKTAKEIKESGEILSDYVKIDTDTGIGELLGETNKLVHKDDFERLKYVQSYLNYDSVFSEGALGRIVDVTDKITYVLKSTNTLLRPGHHVVSIIGEAAMNLLAGVRLSSYNNTARILNRFRPGQYENAGEPFKAYAELNAAKGKRLKADEFDNIYWIRPDGKREIVPDEIIYRLAERWGVLVHPGGSLEDFMVTGDAMLKGAYAGWHRGMNKISVFASHRDNFFRLTHFIDELQKTTGAKSIEEAAMAAATAIREWHPTAGSLSAFERKYARRAVYFYTWQRIALTKIIATMLERPGIATIPSKVQYAIADANGFNPESFGDPWDPDGIYASWHTGQLWGPQFQGPAGEGDAWGIQPAIQPIDIIGQIAKTFTLQPGQDPLTSMAQGAGDLMGANLNPVIRTLIESSAQSRLGEGGDLPGAPEYLLNQIGVVNTISKLTGIGQDPNPYETPQETEEKNARLVFNLLFGQRVTDYSTPATQYRWTLDQQEIARRLAGQ